MDCGLGHWGSRMVSCPSVKDPIFLGSCSGKRLPSGTVVDQRAQLCGIASALLPPPTDDPVHGSAQAWKRWVQEANEDVLVHEGEKVPWCTQGVTWARRGVITEGRGLWDVLHTRDSIFKCHAFRVCFVPSNPSLICGAGCGRIQHNRAQKKNRPRPLPPQLLQRSP